MNSRYTWDKGCYREVIDGVERVEIPEGTGIARWWHANGRPAKELPLQNGVPEGVACEWHENGILARITPYTAGRVNGVVKQWNSGGRLLGSYELRMGRGTVTEWNDDGSLRLVKDVIAAGCEHDRIWDPSGGFREVYVWKDHLVSETEFYRKADRFHVAA